MSKSSSTNCETYGRNKNRLQIFFFGNPYPANVENMVSS